MKQFFLASIFSVSTLFSLGQCKLSTHLSADDVMYYYIEPVKFYWTSSKALRGGVITDEQNYFLALMPKPYPPKSKNLKLKEDAVVTLSNNQKYILTHFDTVYPGDSALLLMYVIPENNLEDFKTFEVNRVVLNLNEKNETVFNFKLHKAAVKEQIACLMSELKK